MLYLCILCIDLSIYLFALCVPCLTVFVTCFVKHFVIFVGVFVILWLNVMKLMSMGEVLCWMYHLWFSKVSEYSTCDLSVHLDTLLISFVCVCVCHKISPYFRVRELDHLCLVGSVPCVVGAVVVVNVMRVLRVGFTNPVGTGGV